jgi:hypothetical protein
MRSSAFVIVVLFATLFALMPAQPAAADDGGFALPDHPLPLTRAQYEALQQIARQPQHAAIGQMRATYRDQTTQFALDGGQIGFQGGLLGTIIGLLIAAAPL